MTLFPKIIAAQRLQTWLLGTALVSVCLTGILVFDLTRNLRTVVISDTNRNLTNAVTELMQASETKEARPPASEALDRLLKPVSYEVLRSHADIEGGYIWGDQVVGHSFPTYTEPGSVLRQPEIESTEVMLALAESRQRGGVVHRTRQDGGDLVLIAAIAGEKGGPGAWCLRRILNFSEASEVTKRLLLIGVLVIAVGATGFVLTLSFNLQRGFAQIQTGLASLETDATYRLPDQNHELRPIVRAVNAMAESRQRLENDLRREDRLRVMGRVVAGIAHEIRNPLNSLRLTTRLLARRFRSEPMEEVELITGEIDRLEALVRSLLVFRQDGPGRIHKQELGPILDRTLALVRPHAEERQVTIGVSPVPDCAALVDADYVQQGLMNVLLNAIDVSVPGSRVEVAVERRVREVAIHVRDAGPGLTAEQRERVFEAFYTTKAGGTGLGLAVTRTLLEKMGGKISVAPAGAGGAEFTISLPVEAWA